MVLPPVEPGVAQLISGTNPLILEDEVPRPDSSGSAAILTLPAKTEVPYPVAMSQSRTARTTLVAAGLGLLLAACGGTDSNLRTITDDQSLSRFDVPFDWNTYEHEELSTLERLPFDATYQGFSFPAVTSIGFDGAPVQDVSRLNAHLADADYPIGAASVRTVGELERDFVSRALLAQSVVPYYTLGNPDEITKERFSFGSGFDGIRLLVSFENEAGNGLGVAYLIAVSNSDDSRIYSIVAGCNRDCFVANQETITKVVDSWLVNRKG